jgi:NAD(P)-dependent dehydrogenase (short-subunit alcohol dehydrogenase family)
MAKATVDLEVTLAPRVTGAATVHAGRGDTLIIAMRDVSDLERVEALTERIRRELPGLRVVVIDGVTGLAVYTPGG